MNQLGKNSIGLFFLLMLIFPTVLQIERGLFLSFILLGAIIALASNSVTWRISIKILFWLVVCVTNSVFFIFWGVLHNSPGAISVSTVYVVWPILFILLIGLSSRIDIYVFLIKLLMCGSFLVSISAIILVTSRFFSEFVFLEPYFELLGGDVGLHEGTIGFALASMPTSIYCLVFSIPFYFMLNKSSPLFSLKWKYIALANIVLSSFVMLLSGRKAFFILALATPLLTLIAITISSGKIVDIRKYLKFFVNLFTVLLVLFLLSNLIFDIDIFSVYDNVVKGFDFDDRSNVSAYRRGEQFSALMEEWKSSPVFGLGLGNGATGAPGDVDPWAYELQYVSLLFQVGVIGFIIYSIAVFWLFSQLFKFSRLDKDYSILMIPSAVALAGFLIANATNPYLSKFDYLWVLFMPIGLVNSALLRKSSEHD